MSLAVLLVKWKDLMVTFFDESHARSIGLNPTLLRIVFFTLLAACTVAALQTVGAFLVIAMVVTPGATAYLLTDRFPRLIVISVAIGAVTELRRRLSSATSSTAPPAASSSCLQTLLFLARLRLRPEARHARRPPPRRRGAGGRRDEPRRDAAPARSSSSSCGARC